jgi:ribose 5-phosphate isomerase B
MRRSFGAAAVIAALTLAACGGSDSTNSGGAATEGSAKLKNMTKATLILDFLPNAVHAGIYRAAAAGYYADNNIDLKIIQPTSTADTLKLIDAGKADFGIVMGGSGQGEQLAANKVRGVRAALCNDLYTARMARQHNDANVLSIGARVVGIGLAEEIVTTFISTAFEGGRHARRVAMLSELENEF